LEDYGVSIPVDADLRRRAELTSLLRTCRVRKSPRDSGRGSLRQRDAAVLAGLSLRRYAALERGTAARPSLPTIESVASALDMSEAERNALHVLARGQDPPMPLVPPGEEWARIGPQLRSAVAQLNVPAGIVDEMWTVLAGNSALAALTGGWSERAPLDERNFVLLLFTPQSEKLLPDVRILRELAVAGLRYQYVRNLGSTRFAALVERLLDASPQAQELWGRYTIGFPQRRYTIRLRHPSHGVIELGFLMGQISPRMSMVLLLVPDNMTTPGQ
jgi:transcriptional regulator with XRE-family HTH domain